jgi:hypothetical protein
MKNLFFLILLFLIFAFCPQILKGQTEAQRVDLCVKVAGGDATFMSDYPAELSGANEGERAPVYRKPIALRKGNRYRFTICTDEESDGEAILQIYDENKLMGSSYNQDTGKEYQNIDFDCNKTALYHLFISFKDGKAGSAIAILSHVKTL